MRTLADIIEKTEELVSLVVSGHRSQYFEFDYNEERWTIRVSNHRANPNRVEDNVISFVVELPENESSEDSGSWGINKKSFQSVPNQFFLDEDGDFYENFKNMEECLTYVLD